jgi:nitrogen fixation protein NifU and related proteins
MSDDLRQLYQEVILDHGKRPRNLRRIDPASATASGHNPLCGDQVTVYLRVEPSGVVSDLSFEGKGCAISMASASLMTELVKGKKPQQVLELFDAFHRLAREGEDVSLPPELEDDMDRLKVLSGVHQFPVRIKCATLAWHTMKAALEGKQGVTTE